MVVGGTGPRSVVASASYEARVYGVRSAMPMGEARRRCPGLVVVAGTSRRVREDERALIGICREVTPIVEPISIDEAFLDVSGAHRLLGDSGRSRRACARVLDELGLACAIGVGRTKLVAKLASKAAKPRVRPDGFDPGAGIVLVAAGDELAFLHAHPVRAVPGVGPATAERLRRIGVTTVGDLGLVGRQRLVAMFGEAHGATLVDLASGRDDRRVVTDRVVRSIGHEQTFDVDDHDLDSLESKARELAVSVAARCRARGVAARTISVKVRFADFETIDRSRSLDRPVATAAEIAEVAADLLAAWISPAACACSACRCPISPSRTASRPSSWVCSEPDERPRGGAGRRGGDGGGRDPAPVRARRHHLGGGGRAPGGARPSPAGRRAR